MQSKRRVCDKSNKGAVELHKGYRKYVTPDKTIKESAMATTHQVVIRRVMFFECFERSKAENTHSGLIFFGSVANGCIRRMQLERRYRRVFCRFESCHFLEV